MATDPQRGVLRPPRTRIEGFSVVEEDGQIAAAPLAPLHLMSDEDGQFPLTSLNNWEREVVLAELARPNVARLVPQPLTRRGRLTRHRLPRRRHWQLAIHAPRLRVLSTRSAAKSSPPFVDPHGHHLDDALMKLKALARFAGTYGDEFHRIEALAEIDGRMKVIDMKIPVVRDAVLHGEESAIEIYQSNLSIEYLPTGGK